MSAVVLPPLLIAAGCCLHEIGWQLAVLDQAGHELARGPKKQLAWLWTVSTAALIERQAVALGLCCELHSKELLFRLSRPGSGQAAALWLSFDAALAWLANEETARCRRLGCAEPITACSELEATERRPRERRRGRAVPVAAHRLDELQQHGEVASAEPITSTQEPQSAGRSVIEHRRPGHALGRVAPMATLALDELERPGWMAFGEPITSTQEPQTAERGVTWRWWSARSSPGQAALAASRTVWARDGPARGRGAARSESITPAREPSRTNPALLVRRVMHLPCGRWL